MLDNFEELKREWEYDRAVELPKRKYKGNCTKEFCNKLIDLYIDREYEKIQNIEFPWPLEHEITDKRCQNEFRNIIDKDRSIKTLSWLIKRFHKSIIYANCNNSLSAYDGWQEIKKDKELFRRFYANRLRCSDWFKEKDNWKSLLVGYVPEFIYGIGLSTAKFFPLPTYFKPDLAKYLIKNFLNEYTTIFDPFSGYSGRMIGALACGKNYIGQDLCKSSVEESKEIYEFIKPIIKEKFNHDVNCELRYCDSIKEGGYYECLLTCPPYENIESWPGVEPLGYNCDKWIDICLTRYKCERYIFVVDNKITKYKKYIINNIENFSHWGTNKEYIVKIDKEDLKDIDIDNYKNFNIDISNNIKYDHVKNYEYETTFSRYMTYLYNIFNKKYFDKFVTAPKYFIDWINMIYRKFDYDVPIYHIDDNVIDKLEIKELYNKNINNNILIGFSGGLDSVYQTIKCKEKFDNHIELFHLNNINKYENGQSHKASLEIAKYLNLKLYDVKFTSHNNSIYSKEWPENPIKNQYIISLMIEYCIKNNINKITMGDPFNLPIDDATAGINLTDANEITLMFLKIIKENICENIEHIDMIDYIDKINELDEIRKYGLENMFYSCVTAGRLNEYFHKKDEEKYNIKLDKHNCGSHCRKCATLNLLEYYNRGKKFPQEFIDACWNRMWNNGYSSEYFQFNESIPLEQRIKNLHTT